MPHCSWSPLWAIVIKPRVESSEPGCSLEDVVTGAERKTARDGVLYGLAAYGLWGLAPLYFGALRAVPPLEILAHRIVWSALFLAVILTVWSRWRELGRCLLSRQTASLLAVTAILVAVNWLTYIYSVSSNQVLQSSLGY